MGMGSRPRDERNDTEQSLAGPLGNFELGLFISAGYIYIGAELTAFAEAMTAALDVWSQFPDTIKDTDERRVAVTAVAFTAINESC